MTSVFFLCGREILKMMQFKIVSPQLSMYPKLARRSTHVFPSLKMWEILVIPLCDKIFMSSSNNVALLQLNFFSWINISFKGIHNYLWVSSAIMFLMPLFFINLNPSLNLKVPSRILWVHILYMVLNFTVCLKT